MKRAFRRSFAEGWVGVLAASAATLAVLGTAGCGSGTKGPAPAAATSVGPGAGCPSGRPLPAGQRQERDYADLVRLGGRRYLTAGPAGSALPAGRAVAVVRCSEEAHDSPSRTEPDWTDPGSTVLPDGAPLYEVVGVPVECRLAARSADGELRLYVVLPEDRPAGCPA